MEDMMSSSCLVGRHRKSQRKSSDACIQSPVKRYVPKQRSPASLLKGADPVLNPVLSKIPMGNYHGVTQQEVEVQLEEQRAAELAAALQAKRDARRLRKK